MPGPVGTYEAVFGESPNRGNNINVSKIDTPSPSINSNNKSFATFLGLVGSIISGLINYSSAQNTNRHNEELARQQNQWNREQWLLETGYNSPLAQIERLRQAGLNPGLVYGNGIENLAASSPDMVSSQGEAPNFGNPFSNFAQNLTNERLASSNIRLQDSQASLNEAEAHNIESQIEDRELMRGQKERELQQSIRESEQRITNLQQDLSTNVTYNELMRLQCSAQEFLNAFNEETKDLRVEDLKSDIMVKHSEANKNYAQAALFNAQTENEKVSAAINHIVLMDNQVEFFRKTFSLICFVRKYGTIPDVSELEKDYHVNKADAESMKLMSELYNDKDFRESYIKAMTEKNRGDSRQNWWRHSYYAVVTTEILGRFTGMIGNVFNGSAQYSAGGQSPSPATTQTDIKKTTAGARILRRVVK